MKKAAEILQEYGCDDIIPFSENVTMFYPAILNAMEEYGKYCAEKCFEYWSTSAFNDIHFKNWWSEFQRKEEETK